jgi:hypothetical protein
MYMPFPMLMRNYFSDKVGGGDITMDIGIVRNFMIRAGLIIVVIHLGIKEYLMIGEIVTEIIGGVVVLGIIVIFTMVILIIIGGEVLAVDLVDPVGVTYMAVELVDPPIPMGE